MPRTCGHQSRMSTDSREAARLCLCLYPDVMLHTSGQARLSSGKHGSATADKRSFPGDAKPVSTTCQGANYSRP
eukprot:13878091-Alexandrium_andersonii.AAC.1